MTPKNATQLYRTYAILTLKNMDIIAKNENMTSEENKQAALTYMNLYAELLWNFADVIDTLSQKFNFSLSPTLEEKNEINLSDPPFDVDFFNAPREGF